MMSVFKHIIQTVQLQIQQQLPPTPTPDKPTTSVKTGDEINLNTTMLAGAVALVAGLTAYVTTKKRKAVK